MHRCLHGQGASWKTRIDVIAKDKLTPLPLSITFLTISALSFWTSFLLVASILHRKATIAFKHRGHLMTKHLLSTSPTPQLRHGVCMFVIHMYYHNKDLHTVCFVWSKQSTRSALYGNYAIFTFAHNCEKKKSDLSILYMPWRKHREYKKKYATTRHFVLEHPKPERPRISTSVQQDLGIDMIRFASRMKETNLSMHDQSLNEYTTSKCAQVQVECGDFN